MSLSTHKIYVYNGSTYTDISDNIISDTSYPWLAVNSDFTMITQGLTLETATDLSSTKLQVDYAILLTNNEDGTERVKYIGYVESIDYNYGTKTWDYSVNHIFDKLKAKTTTDLGNIVHSASFNSRTVFDNVSSIYSGTNAIQWNDITLTEMFDALLGADWYCGLTFADDLTGLDTNLSAIFTNYCLSSRMLQYLGSDLIDIDLVSTFSGGQYLNTMPLTTGLITAYDFLKEMLKILGCKVYFNFDYNSGSPTPALSFINDDSTPPTIQTFTGADVNSFDEDIKKLSESKYFKITQSCPALTDQIKRPYFKELFYSPVFNDSVYLRITDITTNSDNAENIDITFNQNHNLNFAGIYFKQIRNFIGLDADTDMSINEDFIYKDTNKITVFDTTIEEIGRYAKANEGAAWDIVSITKTANSKVFTITTSAAHGLGTSHFALYLTASGLMMGSIDVLDKVNVVNKTYEWIATLGTNDLKYEVIDATSIKIYRNIDTTGIDGIYGNILYMTTGTVAENGTLQEMLGTVGLPKYYYQSSGMQAITGGGNTQNVTGLDFTAGHGITAGSGDSVRVHGSNGKDGVYTENNTSDLSAGEYFVYDANKLLLYGGGYASTAVVGYSLMQTKPEKYNIERNLVYSKNTDTQNIKFLDNLIIYRPDYSTDSDWKETWFTVQIDAATYNVLTKEADITFWWLYYYSQNYQSIKTNKLNIDDNPTTAPTIMASKSISFNVREHSIDIIQEGSL